MSRAKQVILEMNQLERNKQGKSAAGCMFKHLKEIFLVKRHESKPNGNTWAIPAGHSEAQDENSIRTAIRECREEIGMIPGFMDTGKKHESDLGSMCFHTHLFEVQDKFNIKDLELNNELTEAGWFDKDNLPTPLHPGLEETLKSFGLH